MSGFVAVASRGAPLEPRLLGHLLATLRFRGPDALRVWTRPQIGLGHALCRLPDGKPDGREEEQPASLDGRVWIAGDIRVDGRRELARALDARAAAIADASDAECILRAYERWGLACVDRLVGDLSFAVWDEPRQELFCVRDPLGVKLLYYAVLPQGIVVSNTLDCIRAHPEVSSELNDAAIADFLLFKKNRARDTTSFAAIRRVPPGCSLRWSPTRGLEVTSYWTPPQTGSLSFANGQDYVEAFRELFTAAVADRTRAATVAVAMSGGIDSPGVAAVAQQAGPGAARAVTAHTVVWDPLLPDQERHYAGLAARHLGIPIRYFSGGDYDAFQGADSAELRLPEPGNVSGRQMWFDLCRSFETDSRIVLGGEDADALTRETTSLHLRALRMSGAWRELARACGSYVATFHRLPALGLRTALRRRVLGQRPGGMPALPDWMSPDLVRTFDLQGQWRDYWADDGNPLERRPRLVDALQERRWESVFEAYDAAATRVPVEFRFPFADVRLVTFALSVPAVPWCVDKHIVRTALAGVLPESILRRPKTPLQGDPVLAQLTRSGAEWLDSVGPAESLGRYVKVEQLPKFARGLGVPGIHRALRPSHLNFWLRHVPRILGLDGHSGRTRSGLVGTDVEQVASFTRRAT